MAAPLVVGLSGGADSVSLLLACIAIHQRKTRALPAMPVAVHVHHHLRPSAHEDERWVRDLCSRHGVTLVVKHVHPGRLKGNIAANARLLRYGAIAEVAAELGAKYVAVAHHADDQLETAIMALCRGDGLLRLGGMADARALIGAGDSRTRLIRPLLGVRKAECEAFCRVAGTEWRDDPTNADVDHARARLRRDVMPVLLDLWPGAAAGMKHHTESLHAAHEAMMSSVSSILGAASDSTYWKRDELRDLSAAMLVALFHQVTAGGMDSKTLWAAARAVKSADRAKRQFRCASGMVIKVTEARVSISPAPSAISPPRRATR